MLGGWRAVGVVSSITLCVTPSRTVDSEEVAFLVHTCPLNIWAKIEARLLPQDYMCQDEHE
jgi:hypothetical protein